MDAGGLAQMSYNNFPSSNGLGVPTSGFASRGKGAHIKRLSFEPTRAVDRQDNGAPTPRTSRSHLLAGLRTAPKSASAASFASRAGLEDSIYAKENVRSGMNDPKTAMASTFPRQQTQYMNGNVQMYSLPEQVLAPPEIHIDEHDNDMDPNLYAQLVATNLYLAEQQQRLQQQLISVQAAAQQFQTLNLNGGNPMHQFATPPITPNYAVYQQSQQNVQPVITPVYGAQPGVYSVYNPATGQQSYFVDPNAQLHQMDTRSSPPQQPGTPRFQVSPPESTSQPQSNPRSLSPPKNRRSPPIAQMDHAPLPPPSAGAFRRGHGRVASMRTAIAAANAAADNGPKSSKAMGFTVSTPMTGTFGPGAARAGEHPIRQPRGPPSLDELLAKPTSKHEGSKNFTTRQRRSAVLNLVKAGMERRRAPGSAGSMTPVSESSELAFSTASDGDDTESVRSGSGVLSGGPSLGDARMSAHGAIGSERPSSREKQRSQERGSVDSSFTSASVSSDDGLGGSFAAVFKNAGKKADGAEPNRKAPMLVLTSAEKRKHF